MTTLHTVNKSPFSHSELESCLDISRGGDAILLIENGVFAAKAGNVWHQRLTEAISKGIPVYALKNDLIARGLSAEQCEPIQLMDYADFVELTCHHERTQSWY